LPSSPASHFREETRRGGRHAAAGRFDFGFGFGVHEVRRGMDGDEPMMGGGCL